MKKHQTDLDRGATAVEYALLVAFIAVIIFTAVATLGTKVFTLYHVPF